MMHMGSMIWGGGLLVFGIGITILLLALFGGAKFFGKLRSTKNDRNTPEKVPSSVQQQIFKLAKQNDGKLTVTEVVLETGLSVRQSEEALNILVDGYRVRMDVDVSGMITYEFSELVPQ
jgi:hypothetical protein